MLTRDMSDAGRGDTTVERLLSAEALEEGGDDRSYGRKESVQIRRIGIFGQALFKDLAEVIWETQQFPGHFVLLLSGKNCKARMRNIRHFDVKGGEGGNGGVEVIAEADVGIAHIALGHIEFAPLGESLQEGADGNQ